MTDIRVQLAEHLETLVPTTWTVYAYPPDAPSIPAVVIIPDAAYLVPSSFGQGGPAILTARLTLEIVTQRTDTENALEVLEDLRSIISAGIVTFPLGGARWESWGEYAQIQVADVEVLQGSMAVVVKVPGP